MSETFNYHGHEPQLSLVQLRHGRVQPVIHFGGKERQERPPEWFAEQDEHVTSELVVAFDWAINGEHEGIQEKDERAANGERAALVESIANYAVEQGMPLEVIKASFNKAATPVTQAD